MMNKSIETNRRDPYTQGVFPKHEYTQAHSDAITSQHNENSKFYFMFAGVILLLTTPFFFDFIPVPAELVVVTLLFLGLLASIADMESKTTSFIGLAVSVIAFSVFEFMAMSAYPHMSTENWHVNFWFLVNQILALNFFFAIQQTARYLFVDYLNRKNSRHFQWHLFHFHVFIK